MILGLIIIPTSWSLVLIGGVLPDMLDRGLRLRHRNPVTHNLLLSLALLTLGFVIPPFIVLSVGVLHHLFLDAPTVSGIYVGNKRISLADYKSESVEINALTVLLHLLFLTIIL